jgi:hypothetical protein
MDADDVTRHHSRRLQRNSQRIGPFVQLGAGQMVLPADNGHCVRLFLRKLCNPRGAVAFGDFLRSVAERPCQKDTFLKAQHLEV